MVAAGVPEWFSKTHTCRRASTQRTKEAGASEQDNNEQGLWTEGVGGGAYNQNIPNRRATLGLSGRDLSCISPSTPRLKVVVPPELRALLFPFLEAAEAAYALRLAADKNNVDASLVDFYFAPPCHEARVLPDLGGALGGRGCTPDGVRAAAPLAR